MVATARNSVIHGSGDARDADGDGAITELDLRACIRRCSSNGCEIVDASPGLAGDRTVLSNPAVSGLAPSTGGDSAAAGSTSHDQSSGAIQGGPKVGGTKWKVKHGDTLYSISRRIFPRDTVKQARLRQDIVVLNPAVFVNGANEMAVGAVLELSAYIFIDNSATSSVQPAPGSTALRFMQKTRLRRAAS